MTEIGFPHPLIPTRSDRRAGLPMVLTAATLFALNGSVSKLTLEASGIRTLRWHEPVRTRVWPALGLVLFGLGLVAQVWDGATLDTVGVLAGPAVLLVQILGGLSVVAGIVPAETSR